MKEIKHFWAQTIAELNQIPSQFNREPRATSLANTVVYDISFQSLLNETIYGVLLVPVAEKPSPVVIDFLGYMNHIQEPEYFAHWLEIGCACLVIDNRDQGGKTLDSASYQTVTLDPPMGRGFLTSQDFYMRRVIADHLRAVTLCAQLPEIDSEKLFLHGGSQGGGLALIINALTEQTIQATFANVPSHSSIASRIDEGTGSYGIIHDYIQQHPEMEQQIKDALVPFDTLHLVESIQNPVYTSVGSADPICPMKNFFPTYHKLQAPKELIVYWNKGHDGGGRRQLEKEIRTLKELLKGKFAYENRNL
ncbi:acetylxylan esterase [Enterococcus sp. JM4C]|uniref:acetylxylan esterase n=1 Tax=Candidatus Enterococcus huntleyi TaxID=1857217 RepID=UPI001379F6C6|nr:acetylxylan esterase [Enterococcus sp. JM4C]KAF1297508.1 acetylxylan esterase [Enterococcus sp. JM4C]